MAMKMLTFVTTAAAVALLDSSSSSMAWPLGQLAAKLNTNPASTTEQLITATLQKGEVCYRFCEDESCKSMDKKSYCRAGLECKLKTGQDLLLSSWSLEEGSFNQEWTCQDSSAEKKKSAFRTFHSAIRESKQIALARIRRLDEEPDIVFGRLNVDQPVVAASRRLDNFVVSSANGGEDHQIATNSRLKESVQNQTRQEHPVGRVETVVLIDEMSIVPSTPVEEGLLFRVHKLEAELDYCGNQLNRMIAGIAISLTLLVSAATIVSARSHSRSRRRQHFDSVLPVVHSDVVPGGVVPGVAPGAFDYCPMTEHAVV